MAVHGVVVAAPVLHVPGVALKLVHVGRHQPLEGVSDHEELDGLGDELLEEVLGEQRIFLPQEGVEAEAIVLGDLGLRHLGEVEEGVEPRCGGGL